MLQYDFFVPGSVSRQEHERYRGKDLFREVLTVTGDTTMLYFGRVIQDILSSKSQHYMVIDLKVLARNFNCERGACYVGNPRDLFRAREREFSFRESFAQVGYYGTAHLPFPGFRR